MSTKEELVEIIADLEQIITELSDYVSEQHKNNIYEYSLWNKIDSYKNELNNFKKL